MDEVNEKFDVGRGEGRGGRGGVYIYTCIRSFFLFNTRRANVVNFDEFYEGGES